LLSLIFIHTASNVVGNFMSISIGVIFGIAFYVIYPIYLTRADRRERKTKKLHNRGVIE